MENEIQTDFEQIRLSKPYVGSFFNLIILSNTFSYHKYIYLVLTYHLLQNPLSKAEHIFDTFVTLRRILTNCWLFSY